MYSTVHTHASTIPMNRIPLTQVCAECHVTDVCSTYWRVMQPAYLKMEYVAPIAQSLQQPSHTYAAVCQQHPLPVLRSHTIVQLARITFVCTQGVKYLTGTNPYKVAGRYPYGLLYQTVPSNWWTDMCQNATMQVVHSSYR